MQPTPRPGIVDYVVVVIGFILVLFTLAIWLGFEPTVLHSA